MIEALLKKASAAEMVQQRRAGGVQKTFTLLYCITYK